jgi:hypothetical protein
VLPYCSRRPKLRRMLTHDSIRVSYIGDKLNSARAAADHANTAQKYIVHTCAQVCGYDLKTKDYILI